MIIVGSRSQKNKTKPIACAVCRQWFTRRRSSARFCSSRCRQRAHRRAGLSPVDELRNAKGCSERNVRLTRGPCGSGVGLSTFHPSPKTAPQQPGLASGSVARSLTPHIVPDQHWPNMWRIAFHDGRLSDMLNITRAKEAMTRAQRSSRRSIADIVLHEKGAGTPRRRVRARCSILRA
jgi:hypothetical protein